jgi:two-component system, NtrC family, response regulator AtoC
MPRVLVVDDDPLLRSNLSELFTEEGFDVIVAAGGADAVALAKARAPDLIVCDVAMPGMDGHAVLQAVRAHASTATVPFIFLSARAERSEVRAGMNLGADDYLTKPFQLVELLEATRARLLRLSTLGARADAAARASVPGAAAPALAALPPGIVLEEPAMRAIYEQLEAVAKSQLNVLVLGETGVGKEVFARALHELSMRRSGPFLPLNCAALSEHLLEAELFGHEKGAFTGAVQARPGLFETANGGTLFLDEVGELPLAIQTKLLRVLEDRKILRVGGRTPREVDVRFVAATNRNLKHEVSQRTFREDLYYRLNGMTFTLPPLRERRAEIRPLARVFASRAQVEHGKAFAVTLSDRALARLEQHTWPGNVRELKNVIERAVVLCPTAVLEPEHLPLELGEAPASAGAASPAGAEADPSVRLRQELADIERQRVIDALEQCGGNQSLAAEKLGISRRTLVYRLSAFGLTRSRKRS